MTAHSDLQLREISASRPCALAQSEDRRFQYYTRPRLCYTQIGADYGLIVNSVPKSGSVWMITLLSHLFDLPRENPPHLHHMADIRDASCDLPVLGVVALARDFRDVVVSWFHETKRNDLRAGYTSPRYPTVEAFYSEHLLGYLHCEPRFDCGNLTAWLDFVTANSFPLIRYEDLQTDPCKELRKLMTFWKIDIDDDRIKATAKECNVSKMTNTVQQIGGMVEQAVAHGHLHQGRTGCWRDELPDKVAQDIAVRFEEFQARLGYCAN